MGWGSVGCIALGGTVGGAIQGGGSYVEGVSESTEEFRWQDFGKDVAIGGTVGFVGSFIGGSVGSAVTRSLTFSFGPAAALATGSIVGGGTGSGSAYTTVVILTDEEFSGNDLMEYTAGGAVFGGLFGVTPGVASVLKPSGTIAAARPGSSAIFIPKPVVQNSQQSVAPGTVNATTSTKTPAATPQNGSGFWDEPSIPIGHTGQTELNVVSMNPPGWVNGRYYSGHAFDRMQGRGIMPSVVEDAIQHGLAAPSRGGRNTTVYYSRENNISVVLNENGDVVTVSHGDLR